MGEAIELRTRNADSAGAVEELAPFAEEGALRLPSDHPIADGEWVRFEVQLADGTPFLEGLGRAEGTVAGRIRLSMLQFDTRNEILFERILLAGNPENATGTIDLNTLEALAQVREPPTPVPPPTRAAAPPLPRPPAVPSAKPPPLTPRAV
ncbi:MAG: hypothetical protein AB8I08_26255, partial [Sandaracinaceae bacterium]